VGQIIKVRCNGLNRHINDVDLDDALREDSIARGKDLSSPALPERIVLRCRECIGKVIVTRAMFKDARQ
jgi:hypothetical protein